MALVRFPGEIRQQKRARKPESWRSVIIGGLTVITVLAILIYVAFNPAL